MAGCVELSACFRQEKKEAFAPKETKKKKEAEQKKERAQLILVRRREPLHTGEEGRTRTEQGVKCPVSGCCFGLIAGEGGSRGARRWLDAAVASDTEGWR